MEGLGLQMRVQAQQGTLRLVVWQWAVLPPKYLDPRMEQRVLLKVLAVWWMTGRVLRWAVLLEQG